MYGPTDLKKNVLITLDGQPYKVIEYSQKVMGRGGSIVNVRVKNLITGALIPKTFKGQEKIEPAEVTTKKVQYLYKDDDKFYFMDPTTFEQYELSNDLVGDSKDFMKDGDEMEIQFYNGSAINLTLPKNLWLEVTYTENAVKGDTSTSVMKDATLETGVVIKVPAFIKTGDIVSIVNDKNSLKSLRFSAHKNKNRELQTHVTVNHTIPVSRAENKLAGAAQAFSYDFRDKLVLDIGSSTGGFTEYAINHGAKRVIAVEKGTKQMKAPLRYDQRINLYEKTDIFSITRESLSKDENKIDTILADVSFVSLKKVLDYAKKHLAYRKTDFLVMLKPQFEAKPYELKNGIVKNEKIRRGIIKDFEVWLKDHGFIIINKRDNLLAGKNGNLERFYYLKIAKKTNY